MPKISSAPSKPIVNLAPSLYDLRPLSNREDHLGVRVRLVTSAFLGKLGIITDVVTAEMPEKNERDKGRRGVYYTVALDGVILSGLTWQDFMKEPTNGNRRNC